MSYKHILVPYDGSELSKNALQHAIRLVNERPAAKLTVLHVLHFPNILAGAAFMTVPESLEKDYCDFAELSLEEARREVEGLPYTTVEMRQGFPVETILECAEERGCDLIVMGSRGLSGLKEFVLGSVSHAVVQKAKIPVMIIKDKVSYVKEGGMAV